MLEVKFANRALKLYIFQPQQTHSRGPSRLAGLPTSWAGLIFCQPGGKAFVAVQILAALTLLWIEYDRNAYLAGQNVVERLGGPRCVDVDFKLWHF